jgi:hypothetical protein
MSCCISTLQDQQERSLDYEYRWLRSVLQRGFIWESKFGLEETFEKWYPAVTQGCSTLSIACP